MIEKVTLLNFISHTDTTIPFVPGVTVFLGKVGAGKSSVIDGITYALYGEHTRSINENLVKRRTQGAAVSVQFSFGNKQYLAERRLDKKGKLEGSVLKEIFNGSVRQLASGERRQLGESGMSGEVAKIFGLDYEKMKVAGIIQQGELDSIINLTSKDLKELVSSVIGTDRLEAAYIGMRDVVDSFRGTVRGKYGGQDDTDIETIKNGIAEQEAVYKSSDTTFQTLQGELKALQRKETELTDGVKALEPLKEKTEMVRMKVGLLIDYVKGKRGELVKQIEDAEIVITTATSHFKVLREEAAVSDGLQRVSRNQIENSSLSLQLSQDIARLEALKSKPDETNRIIERARKALELVVRENETRTEYSKIESRLKSCESELVRLEGVKGELKGYRETALKLEFKNHICPLCGSKVERINELLDKESIERHLAEHEHTIGTIQNEKRELEPKFELARDEVTSLQEAISFLQEQHVTALADVHRLEKENGKLVEELKTLPTMIGELAAALKEQDALKSKFGELQEKNTKIHVAKNYLEEHKVSSQADLERLNQEKEGLVQTLASIPEELADPRESSDLSTLSHLAFDDRSKRMMSEVSNLARDAAGFDRAKYDAMILELAELQRTTIPNKNQEVGIWKNKVDAAKDALGELNERLTGLEGVAEYMTFLENIRSKVFHRDGPVSMSLRSWALAQIGLKASEYARLFGIGISSLTLKEKARDMTIECYGTKGFVETSSLSGGEKVAIALALRFALAYIMGGYKLDFIILDEPTVHLDPERKASLVDIISHLGGENSPLKQIIIITHDSEMFENADVDDVWRFEGRAEGTHVSRGIG